MKTQRGFNLVELAIVMVIIGLLLGGVLKGQALVTSAKIKKVNNDFNGVTAAIYTYLDRYNALPGDDTRAKDRWSLTNSPASPNGAIGVANSEEWKLTDPTKEGPLVWVHLRKADLISGDPTEATLALPNNSFDGVIGVQDSPFSGLTGTSVCMTEIPGDIAEILDINFDDGTRNSGLLQALQSSGTAEAAASGPAAGTYTSSETYSICKRI